MGGDYVDGASATVTLNNLTVGHSYAVQIWVDDPRGYGVGRSETLTSSGGSAVSLSYNSTGADGGAGQYAIGTFTASATSQIIAMTCNAGGSTQINAIQVRDITGLSVTFGAGTTIAGNSDVLTAGTLAYAYNLSGTTATVNGVPFTGATSTSPPLAPLPISRYPGLVVITTATAVPPLLTPGCRPAIKRF